MTVRERKNSANSDSASAARRQPERIGYASAAPPGYITRSCRRLRAVILDAIGCLPAVALTFVLTLPLFAPWSIWPLGYVAFVPWLVLRGVPQPERHTN